jgi:molybdopterin converting factor small subunit
VLAAINISVELHGLLAKGKNRHRKLTCDPPLTVRALLDLLEVEPQAVGMVVVNRKLRGLDHALQDGDHVLIAPFLQGG